MLELISRNESALAFLCTAKISSATKIPQQQFSFHQDLTSQSTYLPSNSDTVVTVNLPNQTSSSKFSNCHEIYNFISRHGRRRRAWAGSSVLEVLRLRTTGKLDSEPEWTNEVSSAPMRGKGNHEYDTGMPLAVVGFESRSPWHTVPTPEYQWH